MRGAAVRASLAGLWLASGAAAMPPSPPGERGFSTNVWTVITRDSDGCIHGYLTDPSKEN